MTKQTARLGTLLAVATFLGCPPAGPPKSEGTSGPSPSPRAAEVDYPTFERAAAVNIGMIATQDLAIGGCSAAITPTMEVKLVKNDNTTGGTAWLVQNTCNKDLVVTVADFKLNGTGGDAPVKCKGFPGNAREFPITLPVGEVGVISCRVKPGDDGDYTYKYSVKWDGKEIDPDIIIKRR